MGQDTISQITLYFNIGLIVLFISLAVGLFLAAFTGFRRGVWRSTHNMVFMLGLVFLAFFTLSALTELIGSFNLSQFIKGSFYLSREIDGRVVSYYVPVTSVKETLTEFIQGFYTLYNVHASARSAANFALALSTSVLKIVLFIVEMILIVTFGNLFSMLTWYLIFRHFIPKVAQKIVKIRWLGSLETAVTFLVVTFLFMTPFTSLVNSLNQSYQKHRPSSDDEMVVAIGNFVDAYNKSIFAQVLFNWTVDDTGMTLDTRLFDSFTTGVSEDVAIGLVGELANLTTLVIAAGNGIVSSGNNEITYDPGALITKDVVDLTFDVLIESDLVNSILPVVTEIALNSDLLANYFPSRLVDLSDVEWSEEIGYVKDMVDCVFDSGVIDNLYIEVDGKKQLRSFEGNDLVNFIDSVINDKNFDKLLDVFKSIDQSKALSRVVPAFVYYIVNSDTTGKRQQYMPLSWEEINELSWGYECYILFDFFHKVASIDEDFVKAIFINSKTYEPAAGEEVKSLASLIASHTDDFIDLMVGSVDVSGKPINVDKYGRTKVFENGERKEGAHYCLFDMALMSEALPSLLDGMFELDTFKSTVENVTEKDLVPFHQAVAELNNGVILTNYKKEFRSILNVVSEVAKDESLMDALLGGKGFDSLMKEEGNFFSIEKYHTDCFKKAISRLDDSAILYSAMTPMMKSFLKKESTDDMLFDMGIRNDVIIAAIQQDIKKNEHTLFAEFSKVFDYWEDLNVVYSLAGLASDNSALMNKLSDEKTVESFKKVMKMIYENRVINPIPTKTDNFEENENLYGLLEYVFNNSDGMGLKVTRPLMREVTNWEAEFNAIGDILLHIAQRDIINSKSILSDKLDSAAIEKIKGTGEGCLDLPGLFKKIDGSHIFANTFGEYLDNNVTITGFTDKDNNVCFSNVKQGQWGEEGENLTAMLESLNKLGGDDFLSNFDMGKVNNIAELNNTLHELAHSSMFIYVDENRVSHYQFGKWFYSKISSSLGSYKINEGTENEKTLDLLADPKPAENSSWKWDSNWGNRPGDSGTIDPIFLEWKAKYNTDLEAPKENTNYLAYRDFINIDGYDYYDSNDYDGIKTFWCNYEDTDIDDGKPGFKTLQAQFENDHKEELKDPNPLVPGITYAEDNPYEKIFGSDRFVADYEDVFAVDEISRMVKVMTYSMRISQKKRVGTELVSVKLDEVEPELLENLLTSLNETSCMRIGIYNFYSIVSDDVFKGDGSFSLKNAYNVYMVDVEESLTDQTAFATARAKRQTELDKLTEFYACYYDFKQPVQDPDYPEDPTKTKKILDDSGKFDVSLLVKDVTLFNKTETAMEEFANSFVYQNKGSSYEDDSLTVFQGILRKMLENDEINQLIYMAESPKDQHNIADNVYSGETDALIAKDKVHYLINENFKDDQAIENAGLEQASAKTEQKKEVKNIFDCVHSLYSMKTLDNQDVKNPADLDVKNVKANCIGELLTDLNKSCILCDCVPNLMYKTFIKEEKMVIKSGDDTIDFKRSDPYYQYFFNNDLNDFYYNDPTNPLGYNFDAKYTDYDIESIENLIGDYQEYDTINQAHGNKGLADRATLHELSAEGGTLENMLETMHESKIFHTPARHYAGSHSYYLTQQKWFNPVTDSLENTGFTLFEEMMNKLCTNVKLDTFAYDSTYAPDAVYGSAKNKLHHNINAITERDDDPVDNTHSYKPTPGVDAWTQEIKAIIGLANEASNEEVSTGADLNVSSLQFDKIPPEHIRNLLTCTNDSDLVCDAVPDFVKKGFDNVEITKLSTYNYGEVDATNYNYYRLGQVIYGDYEIESIYEVMESIAVRDPLTNQFVSYLENFGSLNVKNLEDRSIEGLVKYIYRSRILNTNAEDIDNPIYNQLHNKDGNQIGPQGILFYNTLGNDLTGYIARDTVNTPKTTLEKISSLSKLVHFQTTDPLTDEPLGFNDIRYKVESTAIVKMVAETKQDGLQVNATSFNSIEAIRIRKDIIKNIINAAYDAYHGDENYPGEERSYIVSEFSSGLLNTVFDTEYDKIAARGYAFDDSYNFGQTNASLIERDSYDAVNELERDGVDGVLSMLDNLGSPASVETMKSNADSIEANFAKMGSTNGHNSMFGRVIYLAETHYYFKTILLGFDYVDDSSCAIDSHDNVYSDDFSFADYGTRLKTYLEAL